MTSEDLFPIVGLAEIMEIQGGMQPPASTFKDSLEPGYVRFVQIRDFETDAHLTFIKNLAKWRYCDIDDVLIARYGASVGRICRGVAGAYNVALAKVIPKACTNKKFLYYLLKSDYFQKPIIAMSGRSAQAGFNKEDLAAIRVPLPSLLEQEEIALTLGSLDRRINILKDNNLLLDNMAQSLFKSWFIDFDPALFKDGEINPSVKNSFSGGFDSSELGDIPKGWGIERVEDILELAYGKSLKATDRVDGDIPVYGSGGIIGSHNKSLVNGPSIIVGRKGTVGSLYWEDRPFFPIDTVFFVKPKKLLTYCFYLLRTLGLDGMNTDAAVPGLNRNNVYRLKVPKAPDALITVFDEIVSDFRASIYVNTLQIETLANIRDTLLPRLISGRLRVPSSKRNLEGASA